MTLDSWKIIAETRSYIFRWRSCFRQSRVCLSSLITTRTTFTAHLPDPTNFSFHVLIFIYFINFLFATSDICRYCNINNWKLFLNKYNLRSPCSNTWMLMSQSNFTFWFSTDPSGARSYHLNLGKTLVPIIAGKWDFTLSLFLSSQ